MAAYELMIKTNHHLIKGGELTEPQKQNIARQLLTAHSGEREKQGFYRTMSGPLYPMYFIPPYNGGKKLQTVIPMSPKTHILSANAYELEIIRLLALFAPDDPDVKSMVAGTLERLKKSCPGGDCCVGECFHSSLPALRLLAAAAPQDTAWIERLVTKIRKHVDDRRKCGAGAVGYYWLCLSELPVELAEPEMMRYKDRLLQQSGREKDEILFYVARNCLDRLPEVLT